MTAAEERDRFDRRHAAEPVRITMLTGDWTGGASHTRPGVLWRRSVDLLGWVDEHGTVRTDRGHLSWLVTEDERQAGPFDLAPHSQYVVLARRAEPDPDEYARHGRPVPDLSGSFALDEVVAPTEVSALSERLRQWTDPRVVSTDVGSFALQRRYRYFSGTVDWAGSQVSVSLDADDDAPEGAETCDAALGRLREYLSDPGATDARWRAGAAEHLLDLAHHWQADREDAADQPPLTAASFAERIRLEGLSIGTDGTTTPSYDDGGLFWGHVIVVQVEPDGSVSDAEMAG